MDGLLNRCGAESPAVSGYSVVQPIINPLLPPGIGNHLTTTVFNQHTSEFTIWSHVESTTNTTSALVRDVPKIKRWSGQFLGTITAGSASERLFLYSTWFLDQRVRAASHTLPGTAKVGATNSSKDKLSHESNLWSVGSLFSFLSVLSTQLSLETLYFFFLHSTHSSLYYCAS